MPFMPSAKYLRVFTLANHGMSHKAHNRWGNDFSTTRLWPCARWASRASQVHRRHIDSTVMHRMAITSRGANNNQQTHSWSQNVLTYWVWGTAITLRSCFTASFWHQLKQRRIMHSFITTMTCAIGPTLRTRRAWDLIRKAANYYFSYGIEAVKLCQLFNKHVILANSHKPISIVWMNQFGCFGWALSRVEYWAANEQSIAYYGFNNFKGQNFSLVALKHNYSLILVY